MAFTFFFRDRHTLEQKVNLLISGLNQNDPIKVWDAGCAMGPEPYTFAIILAQAIGREWFRKVEIIASDIDETSNFKEIVNNGVYRKFDLSRMPENIFEKYFLKYDDNDHYQIDDMIRKSVKFVTHDLLSLKPFDNNFNAVICKNVLLHFQYEQRIEVIKRSEEHTSELQSH